MATRKIYKEHAVVSGTTGIAIDITDYYDFHRLLTSGSVTLGDDCTITATGTLAKGDSIFIQYDADLNFDGNTFTVLGTVIPETFESVIGSIDAYYNGSAWVVKFLAKVDEAGIVGTTQLTDDSVTAAKIADGAVVAAAIGLKSIAGSKLADNTVDVGQVSTSLKTEIIVVPVSFETGELGNNSVTMPYDGTITSINYVITKAMAATDAGTITPTVDGGTTTPANTSISASTSINTLGSLDLTSGNVFAAGEVLNFVTAKSTAGGKALLSIKINRT